MARTKKPVSVETGKTTLYAKGIGAMDFDTDHADRILKLPNCKWSLTPFDEGEKVQDSAIANDATGANPVG